MDELGSQSLKIGSLLFFIIQSENKGLPKGKDVPTVTVRWGRSQALHFLRLGFSPGSVLDTKPAQFPCPELKSD